MRMVERQAEFFPADQDREVEDSLGTCTPENSRRGGISTGSLRLALLQYGWFPIPNNNMQSPKLKLSVMLSSQDKKLER